MESMSLKARWLENEIAAFKRALDAEGKGSSIRRWDPEYWSMPVSRHQDPQGDRADNYRVCHGGRASTYQVHHGDRASTHQVHHGDRASTHPDCHGDRASTHPGCQEDRASIHQVYHEDRASIHQVRQGDRASTHKDCPEDRASTHQDRQGDRAGTQEECQGSRGAVPQGHLPVRMEWHCFRSSWWWSEAGTPCSTRNHFSDGPGGLADIGGPGDAGSQSACCKVVAKNYGRSHQVL